MIGFDASDRRQAFSAACAAVQEQYPDYTLQTAIDTDFSESC